MSVNRALIVDDSRTAQLRLKKLLQRYQMEVDFAASAEEALGYLSYKMPTVIFMDHHMEGMDGFAALKIIKANPTTAMIPVIMYTSKSDAVYAGQAHALGALDTLAKSLMKPSRVEEVLAKLNIFPAKTAEDRKREAAPTGEALAEQQQHSAAPESNARVSAAEFKAQIARLFELHIADVRTQIAENTKFVVRRLASEIKNSANREKHIDDVPMSLINAEARAETSKLGLVSNALLCLILVALLAISVQLYQSGRHAQQLEENYRQIADSSYQSSLLLDDVVAFSRPRESENSHSQSMLDTLSWALGVNTHFNYGEAPLNENQILNLQNLSFRLHQAGFRGFVELDIRLGNFCLIEAEGGNMVLPTADTPLSRCVFANDQKIDLAAENYTSPAYLQFEQNSAPIRNGDIEFIINVSAFDNPIYGYPEPRQTTTAGQWNAIARQNQQIVLSIDSAE